MTYDDWKTTEPAWMVDAHSEETPRCPDCDEEIDSEGLCICADVDPDRRRDDE